MPAALEGEVKPGTRYAIDLRVANHDESEWGISDAMHRGVFVRSVYFQDPDGILLEFACWMRAFTPADVAHAPAKAKGVDLAVEPDLAAQPQPQPPGA